MIWGIGTSDFTAVAEDDHGVPEFATFADLRDGQDAAVNRVGYLFEYAVICCFESLHADFDVFPGE